MRHRRNGNGAFEYARNRKSEGINALYMDGRIEFGKEDDGVSGFPAVPKVLGALGELENLHQSHPKEGVHPAAAESDDASFL